MIMYNGKPIDLIYKGTQQIGHIYAGDKLIYPERTVQFTVKGSRWFDIYIAGKNFTVDNGAGTVDFYKSYMTRYNLTQNLTIEFPGTKTYTVTISGCIGSIYFNSRDAKLIDVLTPIPCTSVSNVFQNCSSLTSVPSDVFSRLHAVNGYGRSNFGAEYAEYCFSECSALLALPENLLDNDIMSQAESFQGFCHGCTALKTIPAGLFDKCTAATSFKSAFYNCRSLTSIPDGLFDNCESVTNFDRCFYSCRALTGRAPELWKRGNVISHDAVFFGCTGLENYSDIPSGWK